jgi:hypothetical protein
MNALFLQTKECSPAENFRQHFRILMRLINQGTEGEGAEERTKNEMRIKGRRRRMYFDLMCFLKVILINCNLDSKVK